MQGRTTAPEPVDDPVEVGLLLWVRLLVKVYEVDPFLCPKCGSRMTVIVVIRPSVTALRERGASRLARLSKRMKAGPF